jgi:NADH dehydrogenase FAD-containing subunit
MSGDRSSVPDPSSTPARVIVAGGGVAAVETLLALRSLAGDRVTTTVVAPQATFTSSAMAVARVFSRGHLRGVELEVVAHDVVCDSVAEVDPDARRIRCTSGQELPYDHLVLAVGARAPGLAGVYAASDGSSFPIKQGGLATQQADAVAESIAAAVGAAVTPEPYRPVLRAALLTGGDTRYLRHAVAGGDGEGVIAAAPLWYPPAKLVGRYLSQFLLAHDDARSLTVVGACGP